MSEFYEIFDDPASEAMKKDYEIGCDDRFAADGVVMARAGGATWALCAWIRTAMVLNAGKFYNGFG